MKTIFINELKFDTIIGLLDFERTQKQPVSIDAEFIADEFVDYAEICEILQKEFDKNKFEKVEDALNFFEIFFKNKFPNLRHLYMKITKLNIIPNAKVGAFTRIDYEN